MTTPKGTTLIKVRPVPVKQDEPCRPSLCHFAVRPLRSASLEGLLHSSFRLRSLKVKTKGRLVSHTSLVSKLRLYYILYLPKKIGCYVISQPPTLGR